MALMLAPLPGCPGLRIDDLVVTPTVAVALVASTAPAAACPRCGNSTSRLHSRYRRTVADLPCQDRPVALRLMVRRFRCSRSDCPQVVFCERLPGLLDAHARSTTRLAGAHRAIGLALGGEAGSRLADRLDMPTSADTLLRRVKQAPDQPAPPPRYVGIDDWALRKGQRYGTIVTDLERGCVIELLPGRDGEALKTWRKEHPGIEVITRDRWAAFFAGGRRSGSAGEAGRRPLALAEEPARGGRALAGADVRIRPRGVARPPSRREGRGAEVRSRDHRRIAADGRTGRRRFIRQAHFPAGTGSDGEAASTRRGV